MIDVSRHKELFNPENFNIPINIIGAGATGSWLALGLAKLGLSNITVWDFDSIEEHNIANQAYNIGSVGQKKVAALADMIIEATGTSINIHPVKFINQRLSGIVFLMVDSMDARRSIWANSIKMKPAIKLLIEPRMGLDVGRIYNVSPCNLTHIKEYENTYYDDDVAEVSACGNSMTVISTALGVASWCIRQLINYSNDVDLDNEILIDFKFNNIVTTRWEGV
mgnify:CR=1 FL=1